MAVSDFTLQYEISPILLTGGVAGMAGGTVPIIAYTQGEIFTSLISGPGNLGFDEFFAHFQPMPGATLVNDQLGTYPFANQATAANAIITLPLNISMMMICPARNPGEYTRKQSVLAGLKSTLDQHILAGGLFSVNTPAFLYKDCVLLRVSDVSGGETKQVQFRWQWDFSKPLITLQQAQQAQNNLMGKLSNGTHVPPDAAGPNAGAVSWSNTNLTVADAGSGGAPIAVPSAGATGSLGYSGGFNSLQTGSGPTQIPSG